MASHFTRNTALRVSTLVALLVAGWMSSTSQAELRKFVVFLADLPKERGGPPPQLPKRTDIYDAYFDLVKNGPQGRVDSHAEWWQEISYGEVTVSGDVLGWFSLPWPSRPGGFDGNTDFGGSGITPWVELQGGGSFDFTSGEDFDPVIVKFKYDFDGVGTDDYTGNGEPIEWFTDPQFDQYFLPLYTPGERFQDLNGNGVYDAGVPEIGIDKNGNGRIDKGKKAGSWSELLAANITYPTDQDVQPIFNSWVNDTEWFDSNGDGAWGVDGSEFPIDFSPDGNFVYWGDWGGAEPWVDRKEAGQLGSPAAPPDGSNSPIASFRDFLFQVQDPEQEDVEWWDIQGNEFRDFPEPFEDYMRRWNANAHDFTRTSEQYVRDNFPGDVERLLKRTGNHRYDAPNNWSNVGNVNNTNKGQPIQPFLLDTDERVEQVRRDAKSNESTLSDDGVPVWYEQFWDEYFGTTAPDWDFSIPYVRRFNPAIPIPQAVGQSTQPEMKFEPNAGGPTGNGKPYRNETFAGTVRPDPKDPADGTFDGVAEFRDLPSSIYHSGGDQMFGEVTSPSNTSTWGEDIVAAGGFPQQDGLVEPAGPLAYNVHGDGGFDAGNVLTLEYMTWRTDGTSFTDEGIDFDGDGVVDFIFQYCRDVNLDGMMDWGETPGVQAEVGLPGRTALSNYGVDCRPGTPPNGGPASEYPFNRMRLVEDCVAATDQSVDWDDFYTNVGDFGHKISGLVLLPGDIAKGMFGLPAPSLDYQVLTRDNEADPDNPIQSTRGNYYSASFFDGLGISLQDDGGEGGQFDVGAYHTPFAAHEYGHSWEQYPDLYDYDVYRSGFTGKILNYPIGRWCVMAGGGLVHPVPILKERESKWIVPVDITRELIPAGTTVVEFKAWEFNRDKTVKVYSNPLFPKETFYLWRNNPGEIDNSGRLVKQAFDLFQPGWGLLIMHVDDQGNGEGLPNQQRLEGHFTYQMEQADGKHDLESGRNTGDDGDPFPGSSGKTQFTAVTDPASKWYSGQPTGLDIINIETELNVTRATIRWTPRELPTFAFIQPPGGVSVNGIYQIRYSAYDQYGGTTIEFYAVKNVEGGTLDYRQGIFLGNTGKAPGEVESAFGADISDLEDGTYQFYVRLLAGIGVDNHAENQASVPRAGIGNVGNGILEVTNVNPDVSRFERWTVTCINDQPSGLETWAVEGSLSGAQGNQATTGSVYDSDPDEFGVSSLSFQISSGNVPFRRGDSFIFLTTGLTDFSPAVLVNDGEVVEPVEPIARARTENGLTSGLAPLTITFRHDDSEDPRGASMTFTWDFGDGSQNTTTDQLTKPIPHTYTVPGEYTATLTVTNSFDLSSQATLAITIKDALPPTVRATATPVTGVFPLNVTFNGDQTTDPNSGTQGLDFVWDFGDGSAPVTTSKATHTYAASGTYRATLTVTNRPYGKSASKTIDIRVDGPPANLAPTAAFDVDRRSGRAPLAVRFDASRSSDPERGALQYAWNFGDRSPIDTSGPIVTHSFNGVGTYNATLTVTDDKGQKDTATLAIVVTSDGASGNSAPVASITSDVTQGPAPLTVNFNASSSADPDGGALSYAWDFGDGSPQVTGPIVAHTFTAAREYTVILAVRDVGGATGQTSVKIVVASPVDGSGQDNPGTDNPGDAVNACATGCGPAGLMPMMLTLAALMGVRRFKSRLIG